jgi:hypothetical protein
MSAYIKFCIAGQECKICSKTSGSEARYSKLRVLELLNQLQGFNRKGRRKSNWLDIKINKDNGEVFLEFYFSYFERLAMLCYLCDGKSPIILDALSAYSRKVCDPLTEGLDLTGKDELDKNKDQHADDIEKRKN